MDALLVQGVTELVDQILQTSGTSSAAEFSVQRSDIDKLDKDQRHDLLCWPLVTISRRSGTLAKDGMRSEEVCMSVLGGRKWTGVSLGWDR